MNTAATVKHRLSDFLADQHGGTAPDIVGLARIGTGRSTDNWMFDLHSPSGDGLPSESLILRIDPEGGLVDTDRFVEFSLLQHLHGSGLPTPKARWIDRDGRWLGRPTLVMDRLPGVCEYRVLSDPHRPVEERLHLARSFCELLAQVHAVPWESLGLQSVLHRPEGYGARAELAAWNQIRLQDQLEPMPELDYAHYILRRSAPEPEKVTLVHADFKPGNLLLEGTKVTALLDWELAHLGDPLEDLGWVTQPLRRSEHLIEDVWQVEDLIAHYEQTVGTPVDRQSLRWWQNYSTFKTAVMQVSGQRSFLEGRSDQPYRPTRRVLTTLLQSLTEEVAA